MVLESRRYYENWELYPTVSSDFFLKKSTFPLCFHFTIYPWELRWSGMSLRTWNFSRWFGLRCPTQWYKKNPKNFLDIRIFCNRKLLKNTKFDLRGKSGLTSGMRSELWLEISCLNQYHFYSMLFDWRLLISNRLHNVFKKRHLLFFSEKFNWNFKNLKLRLNRRFISIKPALGWLKVLRDNVFIAIQM